jgi:putative endonuclease
MALHNEIGDLGELLAVEWLKTRGFQILEENWRYSYYEIDIIATKEDILHFVEVKTRTTLLFGNPEDDVTDKKISYLMNAAEEYMYRNSIEPVPPAIVPRVQYDVLCVTIIDDLEPEYYFIEDVYLY